MTRPHGRRSIEAPPSRADVVGRTAIEIPEETKQALRLHLRLATCRNLLMRGARLSIQPWGLTLPQFDVLAELSRAGREGFTFVELSRLLLVTSGNLTGIVDRLEAEGLVRRQTDTRDRRLIRIVLTRKGRRLAQQIMPRHARDIQAMLAFLPPDRLTTLIEMLSSLRDGLRAQSLEEDDERAATPSNRGTLRRRRTPAARGRRPSGYSVQERRSARASGTPAQQPKRD